MSLVKKVFITSSSVFILLLLLWGVYFFSFKKPAEKTVEVPEETSFVEKIETFIKGKPLLSISDEAVLGPVLMKDDSAIKYYSKENGKLYQIEFDGSQKSVLSDKEIFGLTSAIWSPDTNRAITSFIANGKTSFSSYNYSTRDEFNLGENLSSVTWQNNEKILYKYYDATKKEGTLNISNPDGSDWKKLVDVDFSYLGVAPVPMTGLISFWNLGDGFAETSLQTISVLGGEKRVIFNEKFGADYLWSPDGKSLLISNTLEKSSSKLQLGLTNSSGGEYRDLGLPTIVSKCVWSKNNQDVFCALPGNIPVSSIMPNDYFSNKFTSTDTFWKIDTRNGKKSRLLDQAKNDDLPLVDSINLFLNEDESFLFFINRTDEKLYRLAL